MCNKSNAVKPNFLNLKLDTCPMCGSVTSAIRISHKRVKLEDGSTIYGYSNFKACLACWLEDHHPLNKVDRSILVSILKNVPGEVFQLGEFSYVREYVDAHRLGLLL